MLDTVETSSIVPGANTRASEPSRAWLAVRKLAGLRSLPVSLSVVAHVGIAFVAAQHVASRAAVVREPLGRELAAPDLALDAEPLAAKPEPAAEPEPAAAANAPSSPPATPAAGHAVPQTASAPAHEAIAASSSDADPNPSAAPAAAPIAPAPHFALTVAASAASSGASPNPSNGVAAAGASTAADAPINELSADAPAKLMAGAPPAYTAAAQAAGIEADVPLEIVVDRAGTVQTARALAHIGYGLDEAALAAVRRYRFSAAHRAGNTVSVRMHWLMRFQLR